MAVSGIPIRLATIVAGAFALVSSPTTATEFDAFRGLWVSRFDYDANDELAIRENVHRAADLGVTDLIWQVRAKADAYYDSAFEPPAEEWDQELDPLQVAIDAASQRGVRVHAWLNTMPIWRDTPQPTDPSHVYYSDAPSFRVAGIDGNTEELVGGSSSFSGSYARVNHVLPEVQQHIANVAADIATNYNVDGIHLDYIRWLGPSDAGDGFRPDWDYLPHDAESHRLYTDATGRDGADGSTFAAREAYRQWVQGRITDLVELVGVTVDAVEANEGRQIKLSAAVWNNPTTAERDYMQDYRDWLRRDLLDIAIPMVYLSESNSHLLGGFLNDIFRTPTDTEISIGLGTYLHTEAGGGVGETIDQVQRVYDDGRADSLTFFSYRSLLDGSPLSDERAAALAAWYEEAFESPADFNADGRVDAADYTIWRDLFLQFRDEADANGDGFVGNADYDIWASSYTTGAGAAVLENRFGQAPEPTAGLLALSAALAVNGSAVRSHRPRRFV